jgi:hypothetical protein
MSSARRTMRGLRAGLSAAALALALGPAQAAVPMVPADVLAPHRAIYELSLVETRDQAGVRGATGRLVYEFVRDSCDSFVLNYRQALALETGEGQNGIVDFRSSTREDDAGATFRFDSQSVISGTPDARIAGEARRIGDGVQIELVQPDKKAGSVPVSALFPTQHMRQVLAAARTGERTLETLVFDGGEPGDVATRTFAVIGNALQPGEDVPGDVKGIETVSRLPRWPVTISYFDEAASGGEQTPKFTFNAEIYENGIARALKLDYGRFVVEGRLSRIEPLPASDCAKP